jgi:hypothetical protein
MPESEEAILPTTPAEGTAMSVGGRLLWHGMFQDLVALATQFALAVPEGTISPAALQGFLMCHKRDPAAALASVHQLIATSAESSSM